MRQEPPAPHAWSKRTGSSEELLDLSCAAGDSWTGNAPDYPWGWVYGGRIAAQALRAAAYTCREDLAPSALHGVFTRTAICGQQLDYRVERLADSKRRAIRAVEVGQNGVRNADATVTFDAAPIAGDDSVEGPGAIPQTALTALRRGNYVGASVEVGFFRRRMLNVGDQCVAAEIILDRTPSSKLETACLVAYAADDLPTDCARASVADESYLQGESTALWSLTTSYSMHFCGGQSGRELLFVAQTLGIHGSLASVEGTVVDVASRCIVARCLQQILLRRRRQS